MLLNTWNFDSAVTVRAAVDAASTEEMPGLREAMEAVAGDKGNINTRRLGRFIMKHKLRIEGDRRFVSGANFGELPRWKVECTAKVKRTA